jgi:hypothetical protein
MSFKVEIIGFKSEDEAVEFCAWYSKIGEQMSDTWFECCKDEGKDVRSGIYAKTYDYQAKDNVVIMDVSE